MKSFLGNSKAFALFGLRDLKGNPILKAFIGLLLVAIIVLAFPRNESIEYSVQVGSVWTNDDLIALFSFPISKETPQYEKEKLQAISAVLPVVERRQDVEQARLESLKVIFSNLRAAVDARRRLQKTGAAADSLAMSQALARLPVAISDQQWNLLLQWRASASSRNENMLSKLEQNLRSILTDIFRAGVIDSEVVRNPHKKLAFRKGTMEEIVDKDKLLDVSGAGMELQERLSGVFLQPEVAGFGAEILQNVIRPNVLLNLSETQRLIRIAVEGVPKTLGFVQENERIVSKHERITEETKQKLDSYRRAKVERGSEQDVWTQRVGIVFHVTLIVGLYGIYLFLFRKKIFHDNAMLTVIALLLSMETFFAYLSISLNVVEPIQYLIFVPAASMLLTIIFDSRVAFYGTVTMAFLIAGIRGNDYSIALSSLVAGALGAYTVRDIHNRTQIFRSLGFIFLGYSVSIVALASERFESIETTFTALTFALANAVFSPVLTYGLLIFFERVFHVATDLTLLELSDFNQPLLRLLSEKAPGTFHHSIIIGNLAEAAAEAIGANSILARAGGYYHDIGKVEKPEYFVENQTGTHSKHSKLRPRMSALVIISHVKEGVELARRHGITEKIVDFIPQHHGTNRISYFYDKALKQAAARKNPKDTIHEEDFCYPGPKPQTKETAIVMLADLVEASTRTIDEMSPQKLAQAIENLVKQRFVEGQLDECELTLKDLTKIKEAFLKILTGIHHQRIQYPEQIVESPPPVEKPPEPKQEVPQPAVPQEAVVAEPKPSTLAVPPETQGQPEAGTPAEVHEAQVPPESNSQEQ